MICALFTSRALPPNQRCALTISGNCASNRARAAPWKRFSGMRDSQEIIKVPFGTHTVPKMEYLCRNGIRIYADIIALTLPQVMGIRQQIMRLKRPAAVKSKAVEVELHPA